ncbi:MAG: hypothetical protein WCK96_07110 [Methylococcales bacterium]
MKTITIEISDHDCPELLKLLKKFSARVIKESDLEDIALVNAIQEGEKSKTILRADVFKLFEEPSCR